MRTGVWPHKECSPFRALQVGAAAAVAVGAVHVRHGATAGDDDVDVVAGAPAEEAKDCVGSAATV